MTVNKLTYPAKENAVQEKINEIIDNLGTSITVDQTYDGTSANPQSGAAINGELTSNYQTKLVSGTNIKTINSTSLLGSGDIPVLQNTATGSNALTLLGTACSVPNGINIGYGSSADRECVSIGTNATTNNLGVAIGYNTEANYSHSTALGMASKSTANGAIQIGYGTNSTANTLSIGFNGGNLNKNWQLLDGTTGLIPDARISTNIARTSQIPTVPTKISDLTDDTATTPIDKADTLTNLTATVTELNYCDGVTSDIQTQLDGKVSKSGDTMTGDLEITKARDGLPYYICNISDLGQDESISSNIYQSILRITDKDGNRMGNIEYYKAPDGTHAITINDKKDTATASYSALRVGWDANGNAYITFPDTTCVDGQYTETNETIVSSLNLNNANSADTGWYTLSSLPDNDEYLCWIIGRGSTGSTSGNYIYCRVVSDIVTDYMTCCATRTRTASTVTSEGVICIPVKNKRVKFKRDVNWNGTGLFVLRGYRRIGTNA